MARYVELQGIEDNMVDVTNAGLKGYTDFCYLHFWTMKSVREMLTGGLKLRKTATKAELTILATRWSTNELLEVQEKWTTATNTEVWHLRKGDGSITIEELIDIMPDDGLVGMERATGTLREEHTRGTCTGHKLGSNINQGGDDGNAVAVAAVGFPSTTPPIRVYQRHS